MSVSCPGNPCSGNGVCSASQNLCHCASGWTGPACETQLASTGPLPPWSLPVIAGAPPQYSSFDPYGDHHPVFNLSALPTVRITLPEELLISELNPYNLFNDSYADGELSFFSETVYATNVPIGIRPKGMGTRTDIKKPWDIKFKGSDFFGLKKVGIKCGNGSDPDDDSVMKALLTFLFGRAVGVPVSRTGFLVLYLNNRYEGLYYWEETGDTKEFLKSRFGTSKGNLMKLHWHVPLHYLGPDPQTYLNVTHKMFGGATTPYYKQAIGDGDLSDFVGLLQYLNESMTAPLDTSLVDAEEIIRHLVMESFFWMIDNFVDGNNYFLFNRHGKQWSVFIHDLDSVFTADPGPRVERNVLAYALNYRVVPAWESFNPLRYRAIFEKNATFLSYMGQTLKSAVFPALPAIYAQVSQFVFPSFALDQLQHFAYNHSASGFEAAYKATVKRLQQREQDVLNQLHRQ